MVTGSRGSTGLPSGRAHRSLGVFLTACLVAVTLTPTFANPRGLRLRVEAATSRSRAYVHEEILYTLRLVRSGEGVRVEYREPAFGGFRPVRLPRREIQRAGPDGRREIVTEIPYLLVPRHPGTLVIGPAAFFVRSPRGSRGSDRDDPFFDRGREEVLRTRPVTVEVASLPPWSGNPPFRGLVGRFTLRAEVDATAVQAGSPLGLAVILKGCGTFGKPAAPELQAPSGVQVHAEAPVDRIAPGPEGSCGERRFPYVLIPSEPGTIRVGPFRVVFFDPRRARYDVAETGPLEITVSPPNLGWPGRAAAVTVGLVILVGVAVHRRRGRRPSPTAPKPLQLPDHVRPRPPIEAWKRTQNVEEQARLLHRALLDVVQAHRRRQCPVLTSAEVLEILEERNYPAARAHDLVRILEALDRARFAPPPLRPVDVGDLAEAAVRHTHALAGTAEPVAAVPSRLLKKQPAAHPTEGVPNHEV